MGEQDTALIRQAQLRDYGAYARLFPELESESILEMPASWEQATCPASLVAEMDGQVVGYVQAFAEHGSGHIAQLVVDAEWRRRGIGRQLLLAAGRLLRGRKCSSWTINVKANNGPALRLYERLGFRRESIRHQLRVPWGAENRMRYERPPARIFRVERWDDAGMAKVFHFSPRLLEEHRREAKDNLVFGAANEHRLIVGLCAFSPSFSRVRLVRIRHPEWAAPLLAELADHRDPESKAFLIDLFEGPLCTTLRRAGARPVLSIINLRGEIPGLRG